MLSNSISQIVATSYPLVLKNMKGGADQFSESALLRELERQGAIVRKALGSTIETPLDYQRNSSAQVLATDFTASGVTQTEVIGTASYTPVGISVAINWSKLDEAKNAQDKINFVTGLIENGVRSHDDLLEATLFTGSNGLIGFDTLITEDGTGTIGGLVAGTDTFWMNQFEDWGADDLLPHFLELSDRCLKGTGSSMGPTIVVSGATTHGTYEGELVANQRYLDSSQAKGGFVALGVRNARYIFSPYGGESAYFLNPKSYKVVVSSEFFRAQGPVQELDTVQGNNMKIFSALQVVTDNRSRLGVAFT